MTPHLCHIFPSFDFGGPEVRTATIINGAGDAFRHTVVSISGETACREKVEGGASVTYAPPPRRSGRLGYTGSLVRTLRALRPDLVLTYGWGSVHGVLAARLYGRAPHLHGEDGFLPEEAHRQLPRRLMARRVLLRTPALVVCPSQTLMRIARERWWLPARKVRYVPNGVDLARFAPGPAVEARRRLGVGPDEVVVGTVSRLRPEKNHERLIRAFAAASAAPGPPARLLIVGDGPLRAHLESVARGLGLADRVLFTGQAGDPADLYRVMDVFALSSDTEQMPISVLEAMSVGLPVVSTDVGDVAYMVAPENRPHVHPPAGEDALAASLAELMTRPDRRAALGHANQERCRREYDLAAMTRTYLDLYRSLLKPARTAAAAAG